MSFQKEVSIPLKGDRHRNNPSLPTSNLNVGSQYLLKVTVIGTVETLQEARSLFVSIPLKGNYCRNQKRTVQVCRPYGVSIPLKGNYCRNTYDDYKLMTPEQESQYLLKVTVIGTMKTRNLISMIVVSIPLKGDRHRNQVYGETHPHDQRSQYLSQVILIGTKVVRSEAKSVRSDPNPAQANARPRIVPLSNCSIVFLFSI